VGGPKNAIFWRLEKKIRRERESWKTLDRSRETVEGLFKVGWEAISD